MSFIIKWYITDINHLVFTRSKCNCFDRVFIISVEFQQIKLTSLHRIHVFSTGYCMRIILGVKCYQWAVFWLIKTRITFQALSHFTKVFAFQNTDRVQSQCKMTLYFRIGPVRNRITYWTSVESGWCHPSRDKKLGWH